MANSGEPRSSLSHVACKHVAHGLSVRIPPWLPRPPESDGQECRRRVVLSFTPFDVALGVDTVGSALSLRTAQLCMARPAEAGRCTEEPRT